MRGYSEKGKGTTEQLRLVSYTDASFGANPDNRKSTTGYLFFLGGAPISFGSKTQSLTAQSTVKSELLALSYGAREAVYLSNFLTELGLKDSSQVPIRSDSTGALSVAGNSMFSARTKHIALRYFFVPEHLLGRRVVKGDLVLLDKLAHEEVPKGDMLGPGTEHAISRNAECSCAVAADGDL